MSQNALIKFLVCFESEKYAFGYLQITGVHNTLGAVPWGQPEGSSNPKVLIIKVVEYDSLMIKNFPHCIGGL